MIEDNIVRALNDRLLAYRDALQQERLYRSRSETALTAIYRTASGWEVYHLDAALEALRIIEEITRDILPGSSTQYEDENG